MKNYLVFIDEASQIVVKDLYDFLEDVLEETVGPVHDRLDSVFKTFDFFGEAPDPQMLKAVEADILKAFKWTEGLSQDHDVLASYHHAPHPEAAMMEAFEFWETSEGLGPEAPSSPSPAL
jgi:hypothetical protein